MPPMVPPARSSRRDRPTVGSATVLATVLVLVAATMPAVARAAGDVADPSEIAACRAIVDPLDRAGCYDRLFGGPEEPLAAPAAGESGDGPLAQPDPAAVPGPSLPPSGEVGVAETVRRERGAAALARDAVGVDVPAHDAADARSRPTPLAVRWELDRGTNRGLWLPRGHRRTYILPAQWSDARNDVPASPTQPATRYDAPLNAVEAKFQLSLKMKALDDVLGTRADLWLGYTQQSFWQVYNPTISRPFRETNYEPEVFATLPLRFRVPGLGLTGRFVNVGIVHQSNGQSDPRSRSWNRVYAQAGFERGPFTLLVRPWLRLNDPRTDDDNPDIEDYVGRADLLATWSRRERSVSLLLRNSFRGDWRGYAQLDWSFPVFGNLRGYLQASTGYGESLIDYNHRQTTVGLGVLVIDVL